MKHVILVAVFLCTAWLGQQVYAQQGFGTNQPNKSAAVDIVSTKRGLLIPRVDIPNLGNAAPVTNPATSLLVYNKAGNPTAEGFYFWDGSKWVPFTSGNTEKTTSVAAAADNKAIVTTAPVDPLNPNNTEYRVSVNEANLDLATLSTATGTFNVDKLTGATGGLPNQVLVTGPTGVPTWISPVDFLNDIISVGNGLKKNATTGAIELGGTLNDALTTIATTGSTNQLAITGLETVANANAATQGAFVMVMDASGVLRQQSKADFLQSGGGRNLSTTAGIEISAGDGAGAVLQDLTIGIADLGVTTGKLAADAVTNAKLADDAVQTENILNEAVTVAKIAGNGSNSQVLVTNSTTGAVEWINQADLGNTTTANNGLTKTGNNIQLGGALVAPTIITADATNTLAIAGVQAGNAENRIVVQTAGGVLRNVARSIKLPNAVSGTYTVASQTDYDASAQEIHIDAATTADVTIALPAASTANMGQVINIKKIATDEDYYVNIGSTSGLDGNPAADAVYGALPHQGWAIKSDGSTWKVIGRN